MFKKLFVFAGAFVVCLALSITGFAADSTQVYKKNDLKTWDRENVAGGKGTLSGQYSHNRNDATPEMVIQEIGWMTLKPGDSIGMHKHENNEDAYIIVSGEGVFTDTNGNESAVEAGDITIARAGQSHALKNTGTEDLVFLDVIGQR